MNPTSNHIQLSLRRTLVLRILLPLCLLASLPVFSQTKFGMLVNGDMSTNDKVAIAKSLGVEYVRNAIHMDDWTGSSAAYEKYVASDLKVILNVNYGHAYTSPVPFPTNMVAYAATLNTILTKYPDNELVVIENEETQKGYHSGPKNDYVRMLHTAAPIVHGKGSKITNGGIHPQGICYWVYQDYLDRSLTDSANWWKSATFNSGMLTGLSNPLASINAYWREIDTLLTAYDTLDLDYVNMHYYEPMNGAGDGIHVTANAMHIMADYIFRRTGKHLITNETGQDNTNAALVTNMLTAYKDAHFDYCIWFNGDGDPAMALNESNGILRSNGMAYKSFVNNYNDTIGTGGDEGSEDDLGGIVHKKSYDIHSDTVKILGRGDEPGELQINNATKEVKGFLYNTGQGVTKFKYSFDTAVNINDTTVRFYQSLEDDIYFDVVIKGNTAELPGTVEGSAHHDVNYYQNALPASPAIGDSILVGAIPAAGTDLEGHANQIGGWNGTHWIGFYYAGLFDVAYVTVTQRSYQFKADSTWERISGTAILLNGNNLGGTNSLTLGTNNSGSLSLETKNVKRVTIDTFGVSRFNNNVIIKDPTGGGEVVLIKNVSGEGQVDVNSGALFASSYIKPGIVELFYDSAYIKFRTNGLYSTFLKFAYPTHNNNLYLPNKSGTLATLDDITGGGGIGSLNGLTDASQTFATGTSGSDFNISSASGIHTFNIPDASASNRGLITTNPQDIAGLKTFTSTGIKAPNLATGAGSDKIVTWNATDGFRQLDPAGYNLSYIINQSASKQTANYWADSGRLIKMKADSIIISGSANRYTNASGIGVLNIDSISAQKGIKIWGSAPGSTTADKYVQMYWSSPTSFVIQQIGSTSSFSINPGGVTLQTGGNFSAAGAISGSLFNTSGIDATVNNGPDFSLKFSNARATTTPSTGSGIAITSQGAPGGGTNKSPGNITIATGTSTGTGNGSIIFKTAPAGASGTTDNAATSKLTIDGSNVVVNTNLSLSTPIVTTGSTPSYTIGLAPGAGATASIVGNSVAGLITLNTDATTTSSEDIITVTFPTTLAGTPKAVILTAGNQPTAAQGNKYFVSVISTTAFSIKNTNNALTGSQAYKFYYYVIQ